MAESPKRFEDWEQVDCNECAKYWDSSCDGASKGSQRQCNSFLATRSVVIPNQVKSLEKRVERLTGAVTFLCVVMFLYVLYGYWGWL